MPRSAAAADGHRPATAGVLNGQKTWCSRGAFADWCFGLFRSDPDAERHRGLTYFLFPMDAPGVTVRPIPQLDGEPGFAEIFFDDVFVPDAQVLGAAGRRLEGGDVDRRQRARPEPAQPGPLHRGRGPPRRPLRRSAGCRPRPVADEVARALYRRRGVPSWTPTGRRPRVADGHTVGARGQLQQDLLVRDRPGHPPAALELLGPEAELLGPRRPAAARARGSTATSSPWPGRSTPAPTRSSATWWPSACSGCPRA